MKDFLTWLLADRTEPFDIAVFNFWHILYFLLIFGGIFYTAYRLRSCSVKTQKNVLDGMVYAFTIIYIAGFFLMPFTRSSFTMDMDKLPFHLCTLLCPVICFVQFNTRFAKFFARIKEAVVLLATTGSLMYLCYPGAAVGGISPFCYRVIETFLFHGLMCGWGILNITTKQITPRIKHCWQPLIGLCIVAVWATLGNAAYVDYDWFFIKGVTFGFIVGEQTWLLTPLVILTIFAVVLSVYGVYYACVHYYRKKNTPCEAEPQAETDTATEDLANISH